LLKIVKKCGGNEVSETAHAALEGVEIEEVSRLLRNN
jgi:hypothetical protein